VETRLWNSNWLGRIEYLHYDFGDQGSSFDGTISETSGHLTADVIRGGLSYKFDWSDPAAAPATVGMPLKARPAIASVLDWSGFYLGGHAGFGWGSDPFSSAASSSGLFAGLDDLVLRTDVKSNGFVAGFQAGANRQMGAFVAGVEIDISATGIKGSTTNGDSDLDLTETNTDRFDTLGSARARLGYLVQPNVLLYGTGGLAWTRVNQSFVDFPNGGTPNGASNPAWEFGWTAGAGGETRLWDTNWFWRAEYLHYDFGKSASNGFNVLVNTVGGAGTTVQNLASGHLTTDVVRTGLSYKFN
jgi:outer membrane immunogenic protein